MFENIKEDYRQYKNDKYGVFINFLKILLSPSFISIFFFRIADCIYSVNNKIFYFTAKIIMLIPRILYGIEIEVGAKVGKGLKIIHGSGLVVGHKVIIGENVILSQGVTLGGNSYKTSEFNGEIIEQPVINDNVRISPGAKVIGPIVVGKNSVIGVNSVLTKNCPPNSVVVGYNGIKEKK